MAVESVWEEEARAIESTTEDAPMHETTHNPANCQTVIELIVARLICGINVLGLVWSFYLYASVGLVCFPQ